MKIEKKYYGTTSNGEEVTLFSIKNIKGNSVDIINYGGIITKLYCQDNKGELGNIVLSYDKLEDYEDNKPFLGAIIGRYANRIKDGAFKIENKEIHIDKNIGKNHLHGGFSGFHKKVWQSKTIKRKNSISLVLNYYSKDLEGGFPGNLETTVQYTLNNNDELKIKYSAKTDRKTIVNFTNHSYFNLGSSLDKNIFDHNLLLNATKYLEVTKDLIPTGKLLDVKNSKYNFLKSSKISHELDNCWVINNYINKKIELAASLSNKETGKKIEVYTDEPGIQVYTGNNLEQKHNRNSGICLETQHFPNSPNQSSFPSTELSPGQVFESNTIIRLMNI
ncbi:galactose mutarotase [Flavobacteriaceae bacterium]|nr:galactose mutarotase [Flavobacteriaceae bacterium]